VLESDPSERLHVLPHYKILYAASKVYVYSEKDFDRIANALADVNPSYFPEDIRSPHDLWQFVIHIKCEGEETRLERALKTYTAIYDEAKSKRNRDAGRP